MQKTEKSKTDIVQAAGRALRKSPGKKFGYVLIPVFVSEEQDFDEAAKEQGFEDVAVMTRVLSTADERIVEYLRSISEGFSKSKALASKLYTLANAFIFSEFRPAIIGLIFCFRACKNTLYQKRLV